MAEELDLSKALEEVQQMLSSEDGQEQIQNLLGMLSGQGEENESAAKEEPQKTDPSFDINNLMSGLGDIETLMKIKNVMGAMNSQKNDSNAAFLQALRPFLKKERRDKIDKAAKLLTITNALKAFKNSGLGGG